MTKFTAEQQELLEELIEFTDRGFNINGSVKGNVEGSVEGSVWGDIKGSVGPVKEKPLHTEEATKNPCEELWDKNRVKELEYLLEKAYANLHKLDPDGTLRGYDDD